MDTWEYKTFRTYEMSEAALVERLNQEGVSGWELVAIQALEQNNPPEGGSLPGLSPHAPTGVYLFVLKKLRELPGNTP